MISVIFNKQDDKFVSMTVTGHANFDDLGEDVVCAGVSSIIFGALNGFDELAKDNFDIVVTENLITVNVLESVCISDKLLSFVHLQLKTVEQQYSDNIGITIMEV
ncbi:MAG: ribosomal-processing cysteine protease Prp [Erysipelothrix sp.]|nr:ribosomal-processing cysteine protease Prp [Erysipelothrix sp.]